MKLLMRMMMFGICLAVLSGCMRFTQEDYDLQQKKYERDRQVQEQKDKESVYLKW